MLSRGSVMGFVKLSIIVISILGLVVPMSVGASTESELEAELAELKRQEKHNSDALERSKRQSNNLSSAIDSLDSDIAYTSNRLKNTQSQIDVTNKAVAALSKSIVESERELAILNEKLADAYVTLYELHEVSTLERILRSESIDDVISQTQYVESIQAELQTSISKQNNIKAELDSQKSRASEQKNSLERLSEQLSQSRAGLSSQRNQKDYLLAQTLGEQSVYEKLLTKIKSEVTSISNEIYEARRRAGGFVGGGGTGGYRWAGSCGQVDDWLYYTCQCTSYAAWKFNNIHGVPFNNTRPGSGSAYNWPNLARDQGYTVSSTPRVGDAVSWDRPLFSGDRWGHVAIVEAVYSSNDIAVSEYNWSPALKYSERRINPNNYGTPRYIRP